MYDREKLLNLRHPVLHTFKPEIILIAGDSKFFCALIFMYQDLFKLLERGGY
jgi:hypothetical protein